MSRIPLIIHCSSHSRVRFGIFPPSKEDWADWNCNIDQSDLGNFSVCQSHERPDDLTWLPVAQQAVGWLQPDARTIYISLSPDKPDYSGLLLTQPIPTGTVRPAMTWLIILKQHCSSRTLPQAAGGGGGVFLASTSTSGVGIAVTARKIEAAAKMVLDNMLTVVFGVEVVWNRRWKGEFVSL